MLHRRDDAPGGQELGMASVFTFPVHQPIIKPVQVGPVYAFVSYTWSMPLGEMLVRLKAYKRHLLARGVLKRKSSSCKWVV